MGAISQVAWRIMAVEGQAHSDTEREIVSNFELLESRKIFILMLRPPTIGIISLPLAWRAHPPCHSTCCRSVP